MKTIMLPIIVRPIELPQNHSVNGWVVFEVPKSAKLKEVKWESGGDVVYAETDLKHYLVVPTDDANELVVLRLFVFNEDATRVVMTVDEEAAELRGFGTGEVYKPMVLSLPREELIAKENVELVQESHPSEDRYSCIPPEEDPYTCTLTGSIELPQSHSVRGWMVFEVPRGAKLREMRWDAGDTVFIRS